MQPQENEQIKLALAKCLEQMLLRSQSISVLSRGDYNFSLIGSNRSACCTPGSNNACSDINFYYYDYNYVDNERI